MSKLLKSLICAISLFSGFFVQANAIPVSVTATGTITSGTDYFGTFGNPSSLLAGETFSQTMSFDTASNDAFTSGLGFTETHNSRAESTFITITTSINGHTYSDTVTYLSSPFSNSLQVANFLSTYGQYYDSIYASTCAFVPNVQFFCTTLSAKSTTHHFLPTSSLDQVVTYHLHPDDTSIATVKITDVGVDVTFDGTVDTISLNSGANIPEPGSVALLAGGLFALLGLRARARR